MLLDWSDIYYIKTSIEFILISASAIMDISGTVGGFVGFSLLSGEEEWLTRSILLQFKQKS